jgi:hypothetical protein
VIHFYEAVHGREEQSTPGAPSPLLLEQVSPARRQLGVASQAARPVQKVTVVEAGVASYLHVPHDWRFVVSAKSCLSLAAEDPATRAFCVPVTPGNPVGPFLWVTAPAPSPQLAVEHRVHSVEHQFGDDRRVVPRPTTDHGVQRRDKPGLGRGSVATNQLLGLLMVSFLGALARLDDGLEALVPRRSVIADPVLAHLEAEEIKSNTES